MVLTEEVREPVRLVVVDNSDAQRVEGYQTEHSPVEGLSFDHAADVETHPPLLLVKKSGVLQLGTFNAGSGKGRACQGKDGEQRLRLFLPRKFTGASWGLVLARLHGALNKPGHLREMALERQQCSGKLPAVHELMRALDRNWEANSSGTQFPYLSLGSLCYLLYFLRFVC